MVGYLNVLMMELSLDVVEVPVKVLLLMKTWRFEHLSESFHTLVILVVATSTQLGTLVIGHELANSCPYVLVVEVCCSNQPAPSLPWV